MKKRAIITVYLLASMSVVSAAQTSLNFSYDANGNLIQDNDYVYEYNDWNQMIRMRLLNGTILSEYSYDNEGQRYKKIANSTNETTYYGNENFIQSRNSTGLFETFFYYEDDTLVGRKDPNGSIYYYHPDHLGSTDVITTSGGAVFEDMDYLPFGDELVNSTSRYLYTGKELDRESDLVYFNARYYDPYLGQFVQPDTIIPDVYNPQSLNRYSYVLNNPYKYTDPTGHQGWEEVAAMMAIAALVIDLSNYISYTELVNQNDENLNPELEAELIEKRDSTLTGIVTGAINEKIAGSVVKKVAGLGAEATFTRVLGAVNLLTSTYKRFNVGEEAETVESQNPPTVTVSGSGQEISVRASEKMQQKFKEAGLTVVNSEQPKIEDKKNE